MNGGTSPRDQARIAALEQQVASLVRQTTPTLGLGIGTSTANSALNIRATQLGFPAELTSTYDATDGYSWKQLILDTTGTPGLENPDIQLTGDKAFEIGGNESLASGTRGWMEPDPNAIGYLFLVSDATPPPPAPCGGCGWFAGATEYDCWTMTVIGAGGNMASVDDSQTSAFAWVEDVAFYDGGYWESASNFTVCDYTGKIRLWRNSDGEPQLTLVAPEYAMSLSCCDASSQTLYFSGGNSGNRVLCCERETNEGPAENIFTLAITWTRCPNPDYTTAGWYCVAVSSCSGSRECCYLAEDPGIGVVLCSGPHASETACNDVCSTPSLVVTTCCPDGIPGTLFYEITAGIATTDCSCSVGLIITLTYDAIDGFWSGTNSCVNGGCTNEYAVELECTGGGGGWELRLSGTATGCGANCTGGGSTPVSLNLSQNSCLPFAMGPGSLMPWTSCTAFQCDLGFLVYE
jgi:hypothetical protein